jgi:hypothetical protein
MVLSQYLNSNKSIFIYKYGVFFLFLFNSLFISCNSSVNKDNSIEKNKKIETEHDILKEQSSMLKNKKIKFLRKVVGDTTITSNRILFLYNGYDCETCIDRGYEMVKKIDSTMNKQSVFIISTSSNIGRDQLKNSYKNFIYNDEHDIIRKELKYIYTPVLIYLNSDNKINEIFYPSYTRDLKKEKCFLESVIRKNHIGR